MAHFLLERLLTWMGRQLLGLHICVGTCTSTHVYVHVCAIPMLASFSSVPFDNLKIPWYFLCFYLTTASI